MHENRLTGLFANQRRDVGQQLEQSQSCGFTTNPLATSVTPAQALLYQAAYQQAQQINAKPKWLLAESLN